ncbi:hypothetical protein MES5069_170108 [Mesorhizobium escarrei]|uniref:Uncharacterized protein n=1 Tax=Mesorhizobium escarrei TaxID=666018 RepID=A0ABM9DLA0_9HYPH|nr:hypothetical protein MES5069_170108 [Mesorhizobium escarrei]
MQAGSKPATQAAPDCGPPPSAARHRPQAVRKLLARSHPSPQSQVWSTSHHPASFEHYTVVLWKSHWHPGYGAVSCRPPVPSVRLSPLAKRPLLSTFRGDKHSIALRSFRAAQRSGAGGAVRPVQSAQSVSARKDPVGRRREIGDGCGRARIEPFLVAVPVFACPHQQCARKSGAQGASYVGLGVVADHDRLIWRTVHACQRRLKESRRRLAENGCALQGGKFQCRDEWPCIEAELAVSIPKRPVGGKGQQFGPGAQRAERFIQRRVGEGVSGITDDDGALVAIRQFAKVRRKVGVNQQVWRTAIAKQPFACSVRRGENICLGNGEPHRLQTFENALFRRARGIAYEAYGQAGLAQTRDGVDPAWYGGLAIIEDACEVQQYTSCHRSSMTKSPSGVKSGTGHGCSSWIRG